VRRAMLDLGISATEWESHFDILGKSSKPDVRNVRNIVLRM
jgi:hypothetical protein